MSKGLFITFEGPDGSGKTTQINNLNTYLRGKGIDTVLTREPGGTIIGEKIREIILDIKHTEMSPMTEALLYAASRSQHVDQLIRPALEAGKTVICDRFIDSSIVYQGYGRKLGDCILTINEIAVSNLMPDLTFLLLVDPEIGMKRISNEELDRIESEKIDYHRDVYNGYLELAKKFPDRIIIIDGSKEIEEIENNIIDKVSKFINRGN
ncbi:MAG: dTMP kinase [Clostridiales bacterium]|jgi:dTMP kinase|nr:dTMP kinase [Clostridiales bacterium]